jgi:hypothetical protein
MQATLFMRIHKTASEALAKQICDRLRPAIMCPDAFEWQIRRRTASELRTFSFFHGHISPTSLSVAFGSLRAFTMLRDPRERLLSCFFFWKGRSLGEQGEFFNRMASLSLLEFLRSREPVVYRATYNVQAKLLAGGQFGATDEQRQNVFGPRIEEDELEAEALRGLDRFAFVGLAERYAISLAHVYALLGLGAPPPPEQLNVTQTRPDSYTDLLADPQIDDALSQLTRVDQVIYETARRRTLFDWTGTETG